MLLQEDRAGDLLRNWARWAERWWYRAPGRADLGYFGTGYNAWGVQTNQKYVAAMAVLARRVQIDDATRDWALQRSLASLRYSLATHVSGDGRCSDESQWGHTWISALGIERMMHGIALLGGALTAADHAAIRRVLESESNWLLNHYRRGPHADIQADKWNSSGKNDPESNLWNGALLWRSAAMYPDHPRAGQWRDKALRFLANGVSVAADATDSTIYDGKTLAERHIGASFFDSFALDHHGYFNVGYMVICTSNAAILHFDLKQAKLPSPQLLHLHQKELWQAIRPMIFEDGRLGRIGGDTRVRYAYCQEYLLPSLLYAADHLGEPNVRPLTHGILGLIEQEARHNGDGSFYGKRLAPLAERNPYYYVRLEGDRANALSMAIAYAPLISKTPAEAPTKITTLWFDREYGAALHRSPSRLASFAWRSHGLSQGLCVPPQASNLVEWEENLSGDVRFAQSTHPTEGWGAKVNRQLVRCAVEPFSGGFVTSGTIAEGTDLTLAEGWSADRMALHYLAFVALPDDRTVVGIQLCRMLSRRGIVTSLKGLRLNIPNDLFNGFHRTFETANGSTVLAAAERAEVLDLNSPWVTVDDQLSVMGLYGAPSLVIDRSTSARGGGVPSIHVEQICFGRSPATFMAEPGTIILDCAWIVAANVDAQGMRTLAAANSDPLLPLDNDVLRGVNVKDTLGNEYCIVLNASETPQRARAAGRSFQLPPGGVEISEEWPCSGAAK